MIFIKYFEIGKIINTRGLKGEMKIFCFCCDDIKKFDLVDKIFIDDEDFEIENVSYKKNFVYIKLVGVNNIDDAEKFRDKIIKIDDDLARKIFENEYRRENLYGIKVYEDNNFLGELTEIIKTGAHDVYVIKNENKEILIPAVSEFILDIDLENKIMKVKLIDGMRE